MERQISVCPDSTSSFKSHSGRLKGCAGNTVYEIKQQIKAAPAITEETDEAENTEKDSKEPEAENTDAKDSREASGQNVKVTASRWYQNPFTWIAVIAVLAVAGLLIYHNKKK